MKANRVPEGNLSEKATENPEQGLRTWIVGSIAAVCTLVVVGYFLIQDTWVSRHYKVEIVTHIAYAVWLWLLLAVGGILMGSLGFGLGWKKSLTDEEILLSGFAILTIGVVLLFVAIDRQNHTLIGVGGCHWYSQQVLGAALYSGMVGLFGAILVGLGFRTEKPQDQMPRGHPWVRSGAVAIVVVTVAVTAVLSGQLVYAEKPRELCCYPCPDVELIPRETSRGYELEVVLAEGENLYDFSIFLVNVTANDVGWAGFPVALEHSSLGRGPSGEWLNYTDFDGDGCLSSGDYFSLESTVIATSYEVALLAENNEAEVVSIVVDSP